MTNTIVETASKWGNLYRFRYYLNGRRISDRKAKRIFATATLTKISDVRVSHLAGWRTQWTFPDAA